MYNKFQHIFPSQSLRNTYTTLLQILQCGLQSAGSKCFSLFDVLGTKPNADIQAILRYSPRSHPESTVPGGALKV